MYSDYQIDGYDLMGRKAFQEAMECFKKDLAQHGNNVMSLRGMAICLFELNEKPHALNTIRFAHQLFPYDADTMVIRASMESHFGAIELPIELSRRALAIAPLSPNGMWNLAHYLMKGKQWEEGWKLYEWGVVGGQRKMRTLAPQMTSTTKVSEGETILITTEQGVGDTLMMLRYIPVLKKRYPQAKLILETRWDILPLITEWGVVDHIYAQPDNRSIPVQFDHYISIMSLPWLLELYEPYPEQYIEADPNIVAHCEAIPFSKTKARIGLYWQGNPNHSNDRNRSMPWEVINKVVTPDHQFFTLQPGMELEDMPHVVNLNGDITSWAITSGILAHLDVLVTVDSAIAHLAGAMGLTTCILHPVSWEWRWAGDWYPNVVHFTQKTNGDWLPVIEEVKEWLKTTKRGQPRPISTNDLRVLG